MVDVMFVARLEDRSVFTLSGTDTLTFLQGIVTNDVDPVSAGKPVYTALLTPQGKFLDDFFLFGGVDRVFVDCKSGRRDALMKRLAMYKLRADVVIDPADEHAVFGVFSEEAADPPQIEDGISFPDPRHPALGSRVIAPVSEASDLAERIGAETASFDRYRAIRFRFAIGEGDSEIEAEKTYPLDFGLDRLHGVSFEKGCFVGQEVTARMNSRNLVKRQPVSVELPGSVSAGAGDILTVNDKKIGEIHAVSGQRAIALIEKTAREALTNGDKAQISGTPIEIIFPDWQETPDG